MKGQVEEFVSLFITGILGVIMGLNLVNPVQCAASTAAATMPQYAGIINLLPLLVLFSVIIFGAKFFLKK